MLHFRVEFTLIVTVRRSKIDQNAIGREVGIPYGRSPETCLGLAVSSWLRSSGVRSGPLFRPVHRDNRVLPKRLVGRAVTRVAKKTAAAIGSDPARVGAHSLRSGFCAQAAKAGVSERAIVRTTGHKDVRIVRQYISFATLFEENASGMVGL